VRTVLALAMVLLLVGVALAPHAHAGRDGRHGCLACLLLSGDEARSDTPGAAPSPDVGRWEAERERASPVTGAPLGAVPGQSPPGV